MLLSGAPAWRVGPDPAGGALAARSRRLAGGWLSAGAWGAVLAPVGRVWERVAASGAAAWARRAGAEGLKGGLEVGGRFCIDRLLLVRTLFGVVMICAVTPRPWGADPRIGPGPLGHWDIARSSGDT